MPNVSVVNRGPSGVGITIIGPWRSWHVEGPKPRYFAVSNEEALRIAIQLIEAALPQEKEPEAQPPAT